MKKIPNPDDVEVGQRLRRARVNAGVSQEKLGLALGITFQQVQKYEKGVNRISASRMAAISRHLGLDATYFMKGLGAANPTNDVMAVFHGLMLAPHGTDVAKLWPTIVQRGNASTAMDMLRMAAGERGGS